MDLQLDQGDQKYALDKTKGTTTSDPYRITIEQI